VIWGDFSEKVKQEGRPGGRVEGVKKEGNMDRSHLSLSNDEAYLEKVMISD